jgi:hypothetical protein
VIVREHAAVDFGGGEAAHVFRMHSIVDAFAEPGILGGRDRRFQIDDAGPRLCELELGERILPMCRLTAKVSLSDSCPDEMQ